MEKYGTPTPDPGSDREKTAVAKGLCPKCGSQLRGDVNVLLCPKCGTKPFERLPDDGIRKTEP